MKQRLIALVLTGVALAMPTAGRAETMPPGFDPARHMRVAEVKDGMTGYGLSVFKGTKLERFEVEVISVLRNFNPKYDVVLIKCKGANLEHTGSIAGMSGSPIYLKDEQGRERMIGAFAYGWPLVKDPIAGVQPIEYMLAMPGPTSRPAVLGTGAHQPRSEKRDPANPSALSAQPVRWSAEESMVVPWKSDYPSSHPFSALLARPDARQNDNSKLRPLVTPLMAGGVPPSVLEQMEPMFRSMGMMPLQAGGGGMAGERAGPPAELEPGSAIAVPIMSGDMDLTAIGTVTEVIGGRVLAFGHPFFNEGDVALPMSSGYIHTVIPNLMNSFKLGAATKLRGTVHTDQTVGIAGNIGEAPALVPMEVRCVWADGSSDQTFRFNAAQHQRFTPLLAGMSMVVASSATRELPQHHTLEYDVTLEFANGQTLRVNNLWVNSSAQEIVMGIGGPVMAAMENPFERVGLKKLTGTIKVIREARNAQILSVSLPREKYRPGETVRAFVAYRPFRGAEQILPMEFELPRNLPDGAYEFAVMDWQQHINDEQTARPFRFTAESAEEVFTVLRDLTSVKRNALYMRLLRQPDGVAIGRRAMPSLPSSRRQVLLGAGLSNTTTFISSTSKRVETQHVMSGEARFSITIDKDARVDVGAGPLTSEEAPAAQQRPADAGQTKRDGVARPQPPKPEGK